MKSYIVLSATGGVVATCRILAPDKGFGVIIEWEDPPSNRTISEVGNDEDEIGGYEDLYYEIVVVLNTEDGETKTIFSGRTADEQATLLFDKCNLTGTETLSAFFMLYDEGEWKEDKEMFDINLSELPLDEARQLSEMMTSRGIDDDLNEEDMLLIRLVNTKPYIFKANKKLVKLKWRVPDAADARFYFSLSLFKRADHQEATVKNNFDKQMAIIKCDQEAGDYYGWLNIHEHDTKKAEDDTSADKVIGCTRCFSFTLEAKNSAVAPIQHYPIPSALGLPSIRYCVLSNEDGSFREILNWNLSLDQVHIMHKHLIKKNVTTELPAVAPNHYILDSSNFPKGKLNIKFTINNVNGTWEGELPSFKFHFGTDAQPEPEVVLVKDEENDDEEEEENDPVLKAKKLKHHHLHREDEDDDDDDEHDDEDEEENSRELKLSPHCSKGHNMAYCAVTYKGGKYQCNICYKISAARRYYCKQCSYDLCPSCSSRSTKTSTKTSSKVVKDKKGHTMTYSSPSSYPTGRFICDVCKVLSASKRWNCKTCQYDLCVKCEKVKSTKASKPKPATKAPTIYCKKHHKMKMAKVTYKGGKFACDSCKAISAANRWYCSSCQFDICTGCVTNKKYPKKTVTKKPATKPTKPVTQFKDSQFPPSNHSLTGNIARFKSKFNYVAWRRAKYFAGSKAPLFEQGIDENDIHQGSLGDCWFLCSLAVIAYKHPELIKRLFITKSYNSTSGKFVVQFSKGGRGFKNVEVDDYFPCYSKTQGPAFSHTKNKELWVIVLEKAYAKLHGSYGAIVSGQPHHALTDLTGVPGDSYSLKGMGNSTAIFNKVTTFLKRGYILAGIVPKKNGVWKKKFSLPEGHAYSILDAKKLSNGTMLVKIRNPWGHCEWNGDWSDKSSKWTAKFKKEVNFVSSDDGVFWMEARHFATFFSWMNVLFYRTGYDTIPHGLSYSKANQVCVVSLKASATASCAFALCQDDKRLFATDNRPCKMSAMQLYIMSADPYKPYFAKSSYSRDRDVVCFASLEANKFYYAIGTCGAFDGSKGLSLIIHSSKPVKATVKDSKTRLINTCPRTLKNGAKATGKAQHFPAYGNKATRYTASYPEGVLFYYENHSTKVFKDTLKFKTLTNYTIVGGHASGKSFTVTIKPGESDIVALQKKVMHNSASFTC